MTTTTTQPDPETLQLWPRGDQVTFRGDSASCKSLEIQTGKDWHRATEDERKAVRTEVMARVYWDREVLCCDSALVEGLLRECSETMDNAFSCEEIENLHTNPSDWDCDECREWLDDHQIAWPITPEDLADIAHELRDDEDDKLSDDALAETGHFKYIFETRGEELDLDVWRDAITDNAEPAEVMEWWRVTSWLCGELRGIGEVVIDNDMGYWWGRTCSGQGALMDGTFQQIAAKHV